MNNVFHLFRQKTVAELEAEYLRANMRMRTRLPELDIEAMRECVKTYDAWRVAFLGGARG